MSSTEDELVDWQKEFTKLSHKLNRQAWAASIEGDGMGSMRMRIYLESPEIEELVMKETGGVLMGYPLVFTTYTEEDHQEHLRRREERYKNVELNKEKRRS